MSIQTDDTSWLVTWFLQLWAYLLTRYGEMRELALYCYSEARMLLAVRGRAGALRAAFAGDTRGQAGGGLVNLIIGVMIAAIVVMEVFIPVVNDAQSNLSGTEAVIAGLLSLFAVLLLLISLASPLMRRV